MRRRWALEAVKLCTAIDLRLFTAHGNALAAVAAPAVGRHSAAREHFGRARDGYEEFGIDDLAEETGSRLAG
jgi:hypothetical protein